MKGYRLASPGAMVAIVCFFLPWFVLSGCNEQTTVRGVDALKLVADSNMSVGQKGLYSGPAIAIFFIAVLVVFLGILAWKRGEGRRRDGVGLAGLGVLFMLALGWYLFLLRQQIVAVRYGFWGEVLAGFLLVMGGVINWRFSQQGKAEEDTAVPSSPATWKWGLTAVVLTALFAIGVGLVFPGEENVVTTVSPSSSSPNLVNNAPAAVPTATPAPQTDTTISSGQETGDPLEYITGQVECYASFAWVASGDLTNNSSRPIEANVTLYVSKSGSFYSESATEYFVIQPGMTEPIFFSGPEVEDDPYAEYTCSGTVGALWADE